MQTGETINDHVSFLTPYFFHSKAVGLLVMPVLLPSSHSAANPSMGGRCLSCVKDVPGAPRHVVVG